MTGRQQVGFIGGGRVTRILLGGWRRAGVFSSTILVHEPDDAAFAALAEQHAEVRRASAADVASAAVVFVALHPPVLVSMMPVMRSSLDEQAVVVSLAPRVPLSALIAGLGTGRVARMIPNAPSIIGRGYNPVAFGEGFDAAVRADIAPLFSAWGSWPEVPERDLEVYAIMTGMGPTYYWFQWQALREVAGQCGMSAEQVDDGLRQMVDGAVATLLDSGLTPAAVMDLIPVRPLQGLEESVAAAYRTALPALFAKIRPVSS
jgi:pyrroline-5-carboxylate reductase